MIITKTSKQANTEKMNRATANAGCNVCPSCGETKSMWDYCRKGVYDKGLSMGGVTRRWSKGFFKIKFFQVDCYMCHTCGAQWESEPYEI